MIIYSITQSMDAVSTVRQNVHRSFIPNKTTLTKHCLTPWISKLPRNLSNAIPGKFHGSGGQSKYNSLQNRGNFHMSRTWQISLNFNTARIAKFMGPTWGPPGSCRPQMGPMLAPWTLLSGCVRDQPLKGNDRADVVMFITFPATLRCFLIYDGPWRHGVAVYVVLLHTTGLYRPI